MSPSKAVNTLDPTYSQLTIGVCPDQWGVWFPDADEPPPGLGGDG